MPKNRKRKQRSENEAKKTYFYMNCSKSGTVIPFPYLTNLLAISPDCKTNMDINIVADYFLIEKQNTQSSKTLKTII